MNDGPDVKKMIDVDLKGKTYTKSRQTLKEIKSHELRGLPSILQKMLLVAVPCLVCGENFNRHQLLCNACQQ